MIEKPAGTELAKGAERLGDITAPTLIVYGDQDIADVQQAGPLLAQKIPGAQLVVMANASHLPQMEQPERFNEIVLAFLREAAAEA